MSSEPATSSVAPHRLLVRECVKQFGAVRANDGLNLDFRTGEVHALLGENGAGKSTLIKILAGIYQPDAGTILLDDQELNLENAVSARRVGISVVHQDSALVPRLSVLENVVLQEGGAGRISANLAHRLEQSAQRLGFKLGVSDSVESLTPGDRQRVEIARAVMADARFLILDEPTAVLSPQEKVALFTLLRGLAAEGLGIVVVTHHIGDALQYAERLTILRAGRVVGDARQSSAEMNEDGVIRMMVGEVQFHDHRAEIAARNTDHIGEDVVRVERLSGQFEGESALENVSFTVRSGEVLGVAGVEGDGQRELAAALTGAWTPSGGTIELLGKPMSQYSAGERAAMIADVPDDQLLGTVADISIWENVGVTRFAWHKRPWPREKRGIRARTRELVDEFGIRAAGIGAPVGQLSGGNRRRVVLARELSKQPVLAVLAFASKGLDVRSVEQLKKWARRLAADGVAVVYISADLDEILAVSDRVAVLAHGRVQGVLDVLDADVHSIGRLMLGASETQAVTA